MSNNLISDLTLSRKGDSIVIDYTRMFDGKHRQSKLVKTFTGVDPETGQPKTSKLAAGASAEELQAHAEFIASNYTLNAFAQVQAYEALSPEEKEAYRQAGIESANKNQLNADDFADLLQEVPQV
mgnify:CR=1 FL=1